MNWGLEISNSAIWIAKTYAIAVLGFVLAIALVSRWTRWGAQFWRLGGPYFAPRRSVKPVLMIALILFFAICGVRLNVLLSYWSNGLYDSVQSLDQPSFWFSMRLFGWLATLHVVRTLLNFLAVQAFEIDWRSWLNERWTNDWLAGTAYYRSQFALPKTDNPDQRIQVDIGTFVTSSRTLAIGAVDAAVSLVEFTVILWSLSGPLSIAGTELPRAMVFIVYVYVGLASAVAFRLGRPLIMLSFMSEKLAADFRYALIRVREYAESIAFYRGESVEREGLSRRFAGFIANLWAIVFRSMKFDGFNLVASQGAVVFPFLLQAQRFFSGAIKLGDVMQTGQAFGQVQDALSFFRLSYDSFAAYRAALDRLTGFLDSNDAARALPSVATQEAEGALVIEHLNVQRPDAVPLLSDLAVRLSSGQALLVRGASGCGKTSLLRALAGLWPYAQGKVSRPTGAAALFLSQRPYLPLGTLRGAIAYPSPSVDEKALLSALGQVKLAHLSAQLDVEADWSQILSLGEQQRVAFARILVNRPSVAFLDEATSAMDEGLELTLYQLLRSELSACIVVSVGHRSTLQALHTHTLQLIGDGTWQLDSNPRQ